MARLFGFEPLGYQLVLAAVAVMAMVPLFRIRRRLAGHAWGRLLAVTLFHGVTLTILYYVFWFSALTFGLELLLLLLALDAFLSGDRLPGRPRAFVAWALAAGLAKQRAAHPAARVRRFCCSGGWSLAAALLWMAGIRGRGARAVARHAVRGAPAQALTQLAGPERREFLLSVTTSMPHGSCGGDRALVALAAMAGLRQRIVGLLVSAIVGIGFHFLPAAVGLPLWSLPCGGGLAGGGAHWLPGFFIPATLLLGVDFHVATYLLRPPGLPGAAARAGWRRRSPSVLRRPPGRCASARGLRRCCCRSGPRWRVHAAYDRIPLVAMRQVRATFRFEVETADRSARATNGCLTYDRLWARPARISGVGAGRAGGVAQDDESAQLEKFLKLRGRKDLRVVPLAEARRAAGPVWLFAANSDEIRVLEEVPGAQPLGRFDRGRAATAVYRLTTSAPAMTPR
jgi:hypothetical protein